MRSLCVVDRDRCTSHLCALSALLTGIVAPHTCALSLSQERFHVTLSSLLCLGTWAENALSSSTVSSKRSPEELERQWQLVLATQSSERLLDIRALFDAQDTDGSGNIGADEIEK